MKILIVDDDASLCFALTELFTDEGYDAVSASSGEEAVGKLENESIDIAVLDFNLPGINGIDLLKVIKENFNWVQVIIITAFGSESVAMEAIKKGAYDYVAKPFNNVELLNRVNHIKENILGMGTDDDAELGYFFSSSMKAIIEKIKAIAKTDIPILITGESGTGKEIIARLCHHYSQKAGKFISINCSALPPSLIESELFGSEKGSYTGSTNRKIGFFELASNGTIFLDEIGEMPFEMQAKLLRVLEENEIVRIGGGLPVKINSRVIAATNRDIETEVDRRKFREDLFYRLNVIRIHIPSLKQRRDEIKPLALMFLRDFNRKYNKNIQGFEEETLNVMKHYEWKGNIRELKNKIEQAVVLCGAEWLKTSDMNLTVDSIDDNKNKTADEDIREEKKIQKSFKPENKKSMKSFMYEYDLAKLPEKIVLAKKNIVDNFEKEFILFHLDKNNWNIKRTAERIGLCRQDLYKRMKKVGIDINRNN